MQKKPEAEKQKKAEAAKKKNQEEVQRLSAQIAQLQLEHSSVPIEDKSLYILANSCQDKFVKVWYISEMTNCHMIAFMHELLNESELNFKQTDRSINLILRINNGIVLVTLC